ncbi:hypothetical protein [Paludibaculum fermentans]|uniref:hypothetical protein n=1 Tax=Paludibaculum fermentans TaxID=1473598 RepID=UPI003EB887F2
MSWTDDDLDLALRDLKDEELPLGAAEAVRARVLAEVGKPARRKWWLWALAPAAAAALVLAVVIPFESKPVAPPPLIAKAPAPPKLDPRPATIPAPPVKRVMARAAKAQPRTTPAAAQPVPAAPGETQFVKLITDDPDVVILWAMNSKGAER